VILLEVVVLVPLVVSPPNIGVAGAAGGSAYAADTNSNIDTNKAITPRIYFIINTSQSSENLRIIPYLYDNLYI